MIRFISTIIVFAVFLVFIVLNLNNKCDISLGFKTFEEIPVFLSILGSFTFGLLFAFPFAISFRKKVKKPPKEESAGSGKKRRWGKKKDISTLSPADEISNDKNTYGID